MQTVIQSRGIGALALSVAALALSACGSSGESKQDFVARANGICNNTVRDVRNVAPATGGGAITLSALAKYLGAVAPIVAGEAKQLGALPRPATDQALLRRYLAAVAATAVHYKALADAARAGDRAGDERRDRCVAGRPSRSARDSLRAHRVRRSHRDRAKIALTRTRTA